MRYLLIKLVQAYRLLLSPWVGHSCKFQPTCSVYTIQALREYGTIKGGWLAIKRLAKCGPFGQNVHAYDPVPQGQDEQENARKNI